MKTDQEISPKTRRLHVRFLASSSEEDAQELQRNSQWVALSQGIEATSLMQITVIHSMVRTPENVKSEHLLDSHTNKEIRHRLFRPHEGRFPQNALSRGFRAPLAHRATER